MSRAELYVDHQTLPVIADEGRILTVGRRGEHGTLLPDIDLGDLPFGRTVSRQHAELLVRDGKWYLRVEDTARNPTLIDGAPVASGVETLLQDGSSLRLGNVDVSLRIFQAASVNQVEFQLDSTSVSLMPGGVQQITARLVNRTGYTEHFCVRLEGQGIDPSWYTLTALDNAVQEVSAAGGCPEGAVQVRLFSAPPHAPVPPLESVANIRIAFHPPDDFTSRAGVYPFAISATTDAKPFLTQAATGELTVESFASLTLGLGEDRLYKHQGRFPFSVTNLGNAPAVVEVRGDGEGLAFTEDGTGSSPSPAGGDEPMIPGSIAARLSLAPGASAKGSVHAHARHWHWTGVDRGYNFFISARAVTIAPTGPLRKARPDTSEQRALAQLICPPRIPQWLQALLRALRANLALVTTLILILGIAYVMLHPPEVDTFEADQTSIVEGTTVHLTWNVNSAASVAIDPGVVTAAAPALTPPLPPQAKLFPPLKPVVAAITQVQKKLDQLWRAIFGAKIAGEKDLKPDKTTTYTLTAKRPLPVFPATRTITVQVQSKPKVAAFTATPVQIGHEGENVKLNWGWTGQPPSKVKLIALDGDNVVNEQIYGSGVALATSATVQPYYAKENYELQLFGDDPETPTDTQDLQVTIAKPTLDAFTAAPTPDNVGTSVDLQWQATNATKIIIGQSPIDAQHPDRDLSKLNCDAASGDFGLGFDTIPPGYNKWTYPISQSTRFVLVACNRGGVAFKVAQVPVQSGLRDFRADPATAAKGQPVTLSWHTAGVVALQLDPGGPVDPTLGSIVVTPTATTTYILHATDQSGVMTEKSTTVTVTPATPPKVDYFLITPASVAPNQPVRFSYQVQGAKRIVITTPDGKQVHQDTVDKPVFQGSFQLLPGLTATSTFLLSASGDDPANVTVVPATVTVTAPTPVAKPSASPGTSAAASASASASPSPSPSASPK